MTLRHLSPIHGFTYLPPANKVCEGYVFTPVCQSFCPQGVGWGYPSMHCRWYSSMPCRSPGGSSGPHLGGELRGLARGVSRLTPRGKLRGLAWGVSRPHPGGCFQAHTQGVSRPTPGGVCRGSWGVWPGGISRLTPRGEVEGSGWGGGLQATPLSTGPHQGEVSQHALRQTPLPRASRWLLLWAVRILLECILVSGIVPVKLWNSQELWGQRLCE